MNSQTSVTEWLLGLKQGSDEAAQKIWQCYYQQLLVIAEKRLGQLPRRMSDGEDVVQEAFANLFQGCKEGRFPRLDDRDDLWQLLLMLTDRRAKDCMRRGLADKRGGGGVRGHSVFLQAGEDHDEPHGFDAVPDCEPTPESVDALIDFIRLKWNTFQDDLLMAVTVMKLMGYSNTEIAERHKLTPRTVERKFRLVRRLLAAGN